MRFGSLTPGEPPGTARSAEAVTALPPWIGGEDAESEPERIPVPGDGTDSGPGAEAAGQAASRAGRHCMDTHPPGLHALRAAQSCHILHTLQLGRRSERGQEYRRRQRNGDSARGLRLRQSFPSCSPAPRSSTPKNQVDMQRPLPG